MSIQAVSSYPQEVVKLLKLNLKKMPIVLRMLYTHYEINTDLGIDNVIEIIMNQENIETKFFELNIGNPSLNLVQEKIMATMEHASMYQAWAVKFENIYGMDIYFIPYVKQELGFAITAIIPASKNNLERKFLFPDDITQEFANKRMSKQV